MGRFSATFDGGVVAEPEAFTAGSSHGIHFPVYVNHERKNRETDKYEKTGETSKIRVTLWGDAADDADIRKSDIVEVTGTVKEREFTRKDGTEGRQIETEFVDSIVVKYRREDSQPASSDGFAPDDESGGFV